jgi:sugar-specific transcriptional regulator TrmB
VTEIANSSRIKRTTISNYLSEMLKKGLIGRSITGKRMKYIAESPEKILRDYDGKREAFISSLPELNNIYRSASQKANIRYFE